MRVYEALHPTASIEERLNHPNQYFQASLKFYEEKEEKEGGGKKKDAEKADHKGKESEDAMSVDAAPAALAT